MVHRFAGLLKFPPQIAIAFYWRRFDLPIHKNMAVAGSSWIPTCIRRVAKTYPTGSDVVEVVTDVGPGFAKFLGNKEGPNVLACEYVGTRVASLLDLPTFEHTIFNTTGFQR